MELLARTSALYQPKDTQLTQPLPQKEVIEILSLPSNRVRPFVRSHVPGKRLVSLPLIPVLDGNLRSWFPLSEIHLLDEGRLHLLVPWHGVQDDPLCAQGLLGGDLLDEAHRLPPEAVALEGPGDVEPGDPDDPVVCEVEVGIFLGA